MRIFTTLLLRPTLLGMALTLVPGLLRACPSCYGAPDAPMTEGLSMAIIVLLGVTGTVLGGFITLFIRFRRRARMLMSESLPETTTLE